MKDVKNKHGATIMHDTRETRGNSSNVGGQPASKVRSGGGSKIVGGMKGLQIGTRVTSKETRKR